MKDSFFNKIIKVSFLGQLPGGRRYHFSKRFIKLLLLVVLFNVFGKILYFNQFNIQLKIPHQPTKIGVIIGFLIALYTLQLKKQYSEKTAAQIWLWLSLTIIADSFWGLFYLMSKNFLLPILV